MASDLIDMYSGMAGGMLKNNVGVAPTGDVGAGDSVVHRTPGVKDDADEGNKNAVDVYGAGSDAGAYIVLGKPLSTPKKRVRVIWGPRGDDASMDVDTDALTRVTASLSAIPEDGLLDLRALVMAAKAGQKELAASDMLDDALLRAMIHAAMHYLICFKDAVEAYPNALRILYNGVHVGESEGVSALRAAACAFLKECARIGVNESLEKMEARALELVDKYPLQQLLKDLRSVG